MDMRVTGYGTIRPATTTRRTGAASSSSGSSFADVLAAAQGEGAGASTHISDVAATAAMGGLFALQEITEEEKRRSRWIKRGKDMLSSLDKLRAQLLMGEIPAHMLSELAENLAQEKEEITDPRLMMIIEDIELRVAVELAKLEMAFASKSEI